MTMQMQQTTSRGTDMRQVERWEMLIKQFDRMFSKVVGRVAMLVLPGHKCSHDPDAFRPVHLETPRWRSRPTFVTLSVGPERMMLSVATSTARDGRLHYMNGNGVSPCSFDFYRRPFKGARGAVLDSDRQHSLFTVGCNLLLQLIETSQEPVGEFSLPKLMLLTNCVKIDAGKLDALVASVSPELQDMYRAARRESAGVTCPLGQLFGDAELMSDDDIRDAFAENRAYEDYRHLLGARLPNPARKIFLAHNPARDVLAASQLPADWAASADTALVDKLLRDMRANLPLPERALDSDIINALEKPDQPVTFSVGIEKIPPGAVVAAMRKTFPHGAAIRHVIEDSDLLAAAKKPYEQMVVRAYSCTQVFARESICFPTYATGSLFARERTTGVELA
jgi:hypothetical protein